MTREDGTHAAQSDETGGLRAVDRTVAILSALRDGGAVTLAEVARRSALTDPTALRYLNALRKHGWVVLSNGVYELGMPLFRLGQATLGGREIRSLALPHMQQLVSTFGETVNLGAYYRDELVVIEVLEGTHAIKRGASIGDRDYWHSSGLGKAILASLPPAEADAILESLTLERLTDRTICDRSALGAELALTAERGYAVDDEESEPGLRCVASAIFDRHEHPQFAMSVSGPAGRVGPDLVPGIGEALKERCAAISDLLGSSRSEAVPGSADAATGPSALRRPGSVTRAR